MGKWSELKKKYPAAPVGDPNYQAKVDVVKNVLLGKNDDQVRDRYVEALQSKENLKEQLSLANLEIEACEQVFVSRLEGRGQTNVTFADGLQLYLLDKPSFKITNSLEFVKWLRDPQNQAEYPLSVNPQTMSSRCKARLEAGSPLPPGVELGWVDTTLGKRGVK